MKHLILALLFVIAPAAATESLSDTSITLFGGAGICANSQQWYEISGEDVGFITQNATYQYGASGLDIVTGPGYSVYQGETKLDHGNQSYYKGSHSLEYEGGGVYGNTYAVTDYKPNQPDLICDTQNLGSNDGGNTTVAGNVPSYQSAVVDYSGLGAAGRYETDGIIDNANLTTSARAAGVAGRFNVVRSYEAHAGFDKNSSEENYRMAGHDFYAAAGNQTSDYQVAFDWKWRDFSAPLGIDETSNTSFNLT